MESLAQSVLVPTTKTGGIDIEELSSAFGNALADMGYNEASISFGRSVARSFGPAVQAVFGREPAAVRDLLDHSVLEHVIATARLYASAGNRLPMIVRLVTYLHTGELDTRSAIPECEWVRQRCRLAWSGCSPASPPPYYKVRVNPKLDHPLAAEYIGYLDKLNRRSQKVDKYGLRKLCNWISSQPDFAASTATTIEFRQVTKRHLMTFYRHLLDHVTSGRLKRRTVDGILRSVRNFFRYLFLHNQLATDPARGLPRLSDRPRAPWRILSAAEVTQFLRGLLGASPYPLRDLALFGLLTTLGARPSEIANLRVGDLDLITANVRVLGKGNRERLLPLPGPVLMDLERYLKSRPESLGPDAPLWISEMGRPVTYKTLLRLFHKYRRAAEIFREVGGPHVFRHAFITESLMAGANLEDLRTFVGDRFVRSLDPYVHTTDAGVKAALERAFGETKE